MAVVTFVDTSVLLEILRVPNKSQRPEETHDELRGRVADGETLVLPTATIVETGNHIGQIANGGLRRRCAEAFSRFLLQMVVDDPPWTVSGAHWNAGFLRALCEGDGARLSLVDMATQGVGAGDVSILTEKQDYERRTIGVQVSVWTTDDDFAPYL